MNLLWEMVPAVPSVTTWRIAVGLTSDQEILGMRSGHGNAALITCAKTVMLTVALFFAGVASGPIGLNVAFTTLGMIGSALGSPIRPPLGLATSLTGHTLHTWALYGLPVGLALAIGTAVNGYCKLSNHVSWLNDPRSAARGEIAQFFKDSVLLIACIATLVFVSMLPYGSRELFSLTARLLLR